MATRPRSTSVRGFPSILTPTHFDLRPIQEAIDAARERIEKLEAEASKAGSQSQINELKDQIASLRVQFNALVNRVRLLEAVDVGAFDVVSYTAGEDLAANTAVIGNTPTSVIAAAGNELARSFAVVGVTTITAPAGSTVLVRRRGGMTISGASFTAGLAIYVGSAGTLVHLPNYEALSIPVALALSDTDIWVEPGWPALYDLVFADAQVPYSEFLPVTYKLLLDAVSGVQGQRVLYDDQGRAILTVDGQEIFVGE